MRTVSRFLGTGLALALLCSAAPALAAEGRIPIWTELTIPAPGKYVLTRDITATAGGSAITILGGPGLEEVDIDLNGFTVFGSPGGGVDVIFATGLRSLTIRNGSIRASGGAAGDGISVKGVEKVVIEDVKVVGSVAGIRLEDCASFALRRNIVAGVLGDGIYVLGGGLPTPMSGTIADNNVRDTDSRGIVLETNHSSSIVRDNRVENAGFLGIHATGGSDYIIAENSVEDSGGDGMLLEAGNNSKIYNNVVARSGANGMLLIALGGFLVLDNVSSGNTLDGILVDGFINHIDRNVTNFNGGYGLHFGPGSSGNTYGRNTARANGGAGPCAFLPAVEVCPVPYGGGSAPPDFCNESAAVPGNTSFCDNLLPGPPRS